ncbi:F-box domain-containing protein [Heracleum sosnowskyi]|uniref:F-box domain-containing protein n=1 Tax=Heracleum sosnowskyi TaxID=360622 RepID=A0AAD8MUV3_9APIA|nr:F-box domain-containing protein [Heracleum sosnowskyi]
MASNTKQAKNSSADRISNLPDSLVILILSLLPFNLAVQTSLLSKRWRPLYLSLSNLRFSDSNGNKSGPQFIDSVDRFLVHRENNLDVKELGLNCAGDYDHTRVDMWISQALDHNVKCMSLEFRFNTGLYKLIPDMYTYERFEVLRFKWQILVHIPDDFYFSSLKVLEFCYVTFSSYECVKEILLECPVLEDLVIKKCRWLSGHRLTVCGSELRNLTLKCNEWSHGQKRIKIVLDTPELETLKITDSTLADIYVKDPLENIITAHISVGVVRMQMRDSLFELLDNIYDVECLTLTDKAVGALDGVSDYDLPIFHNLVKLVLRVDNWSCWELLPNILASSPNLESLLLPWGVDLAQTSEQYVCGLWRQPTVVPECLSSHLQTIEFGSFSGTEDEFLLAEYLLLYGKALRKQQSVPEDKSAATPEEL